MHHIALSIYINSSLNCVLNKGLSINNCNNKSHTIGYKWIIMTILKTTSFQLN